MDTRTDKIVDDYNSGVTLYEIMRHYHLQHHTAKEILLTSGRKLQRLEHMSDKDILILAETRDIDEIADYLYITPNTLRRHLKSRNIILTEKKNKDDEYIEKQVKYLHFKQGMPSRRIASSLQIGVGRVWDIVKRSKDTENYIANRMYIDSLQSLGDSGDGMIDYYDLANVFPKQRKYARTY